MSPDEPVATGDRRDAHYESDPDQIVRADFLVKPPGPLPPDMATGRVEAGEIAGAAPPVEDVAVAPDEPSVWDARPLASQPEIQSGAAEEPAPPMPTDNP